MLLVVSILKSLICKIYYRNFDNDNIYNILFFCDINEY